MSYIVNLNVESYYSEHAAFVGRDHVFYVDVGIFTAVPLQDLQGLLNEIS